MLAAALPAAAHADSSPFQSPSGNIACTIAVGAAISATTPTNHRRHRSAPNGEFSGVKCTDSGTGHYFRVSRDSYDLG
ncbi:MAG: hypothetical protein WBR28_26930 [Mycobacterium sp.]